jgi:para-aminobenzoate synthetase/4-amino-4-deoxychorismate lyase
LLTVRRPAFELFETLRHDPGQGFRHLVDHLERLGSSARYFGFAFDGEAIREALEKAVAAEPSRARVRCVLSRDGSLRITVEPLPAAPEGAVLLELDDRRVDPGDALLFHKTTLRERYLGAAERHPDADDVLLVNTRGEVTESTVANVAVRLADAWATPPLDAGLLPGTARASAIREGRLEERTITVEELLAAEEIALLNSVRGWRVARLVS